MSLFHGCTQVIEISLLQARPGINREASTYATLPLGKPLYWFIHYKIYFVFYLDSVDLFFQCVLYLWFEMVIPYFVV